jgi:hypothetical protein
MRRVLSVLLTALALVAGGVLAAQPAWATPINSVAPSITGRAEYGATLTADPGRWGPEPDLYTYRWLRDGEPIANATEVTYLVGLDDLGHRLSVEVTASDDSGTSAATSAPTDRVGRAALRAKGGQKVAGVLRYPRVLVARSGRWNTEPTRLRYQWLRFGKPIAGATEARHRIGPADVGAALRVVITAKAPGYVATTTKTDRTERIRHRVDVRRVVRFSVQTRGAIDTSLATFISQARQTLSDARGWRGAGIEFRRVARGGSMTLVLASAASVPTFSSGCSSQWSCRVGRYVIINQERWKFASPAWNAAGGSLRDYRHMVLNHEVGHFIGLGHASCPGAGRPAPVMMQQSKALNGCRFNPWPTQREVASRTR